MKKPIFYIFATVNSRKLILSFFSALLVVTFLIGSTGITIIIHNCSHCGDISVDAGIFLPPEEPRDHCCEFAENHTIAHKSHSVVGESCHFRIDKLKLANFTPSGKIVVSLPAEAPFIFNIAPVSHLTGNVLVPFTIHNKHGGRYLVTQNCQYLS